MKHLNTIKSIISLEWDMFQQTQNKDGRASCQDNYNTFYAMRLGQFAPWTEGVRLHYLDDLQLATKENRNLVAEKYLRMMEYTHPQEFMAQAHLLPPLSLKQRQLADGICADMITQTIALRQAFPLVSSAGRPLYSKEDGVNGTSVETYQRGELYTYSQETLMALETMVNRMEEQGISLAQQVLLHSVQGYGYRTLEEAEGALKQRS